ncbi:ABC transporter substrate-binding protein [Chitinimonas sp. BJB300]|uniref:ABC transporter substrate-binding protein n=1 Tax=Chitinimonas sp. BJB300 TaxID=1559339 RepID=UPI000C0CC83E|nr:ABC transporter substrate-binding protein [Chitinimonas sp. BJB300]PHV12270.1 sugar ABC transporter substrate-binding protein [Chitinimonas sp. BJB300]TSJ84783.1 carbohydrate ABC transporter substrate-binding protein [Chitinimonas sp. BJB300]
MQPRRLTLALTVACAFSLPAAAGTVEVLHWWTSGGEAKSAAELKKMIEARGHTWKDFAVAGGGGDNAMTVLKTRVVSGNPPVAAQVKGPAIQEWAAEGVLANLDAVSAAEKWDTLLPPVVANVMKYKGHYVAVPVNVHRVNWMWANPEVFKKVGVEPPKSWDEFDAVATKIEKAGFIAVAHGGQPWQDNTVFESVALGIGGAAYYNKAFVKLEPAAINSPTTIKAFDTLRMVRKHMDKDMPGRDWNLATAMVINGKAAMQFMGDWAKGEFAAAGKVPGKDYLCLAAPGTANAFTFNVDSFIVFAQKNKDMKPASDFASTILSTPFQEVFNQNKGSIPVRLGHDMSKFDDCAKKSAADFVASNKSASLVPSFAHQMAQPSAAQGAIQDVVSSFMNSNMTSKEAVAKLLEAAKKK